MLYCWTQASEPQLCSQGTDARSNFCPPPQICGRGNAVHSIAHAYMCTALGQACGSSLDGSGRHVHHQDVCIIGSVAGALQEEVMELRRALQASESAHKSLQLMLQQSVKERAELQKHLTSISKQAQQAKLVEPSPQVIAWGKSSPAGRAPQRQHSAPLGKPRARPSAELS